MATISRNLVQRQNLYIACEQFNFVWDECEVFQFETMWNDGADIYEIAEALNRYVDEVLLLVIDRANKMKIDSREYGVFSKANYVSGGGHLEYREVEKRNKAKTRKPGRPRRDS